MKLLILISLCLLAKESFSQIPANFNRDDSANIINTEIKQQINTNQKDNEFTKEQLKDKILTYTRINQNGNNLIKIGVPMISFGFFTYLGGIALMRNNNRDAGLALSTMGSAGIAAGPMMVAAGEILYRIGKTKRNEYEKRFTISLGLKSVKIAYCF
jgi:hypothetical protein